jgi:large subunit ribosomal protein L7/L12
MAEEKKLSEKLQKIAEQVEGLTALELSELASYLEEKFGVSGMPMMAAAAPAAGAAPAAPAEEKTSFTVVLTEAGAQKLNVIKAVREINPQLGLMDAKKLVETAPQELMKDAKKDAAEEAKKKIEAAGGKVELK